MDPLRSLPKVDALSRSPELQAFSERIRMEASRRAIDTMREEIKSGAAVSGKSAAERAAQIAKEMERFSLRPAINLTGVILHTGLGRARLASSVADHLREIAVGHSTVEIDEDTGKRGDRQGHVRALLCALTGAEDAHVVNNAAAAVVLSLSALARGREVILSRGQMVEIGGSFRMPEIVREGGCELVEVGCTNKTRLSDFESALRPETAAILRCHTSNFRIVGFTEQPDLAELARLAHAYGALCIDDMGTGCIVDTSVYGFAKQPTIQDSVKAGADVVTASGDKLLGGPQAGIIVGKRASLDLIRRHPLARAVRVDKLTLAAMEATLKLYAEGRESEIPTVAYLSRSLDQVKVLAEKIAACAARSNIESGITEVGGGSAPGTGLPTWRVGLGQSNPEATLESLRREGIYGRIEDGQVWLDPRTLDDPEVNVVCEVLKSI